MIKKLIYEKACEMLRVLENEVTAMDDSHVISYALNNIKCLFPGSPYKEWSGKEDIMRACEHFTVHHILMVLSQQYKKLSPNNCIGPCLQSMKGFCFGACQKEDVEKSMIQKSQKGQKEDQTHKEEGKEMNPEHELDEKANELEYWKLETYHILEKYILIHRQTVTEVEMKAAVQLAMASCTQKDMLSYCKCILRRHAPPCDQMLKLENLLKFLDTIIMSNCLQRMDDMQWEDIVINYLDGDEGASEDGVKMENKSYSDSDNLSSSRADHHGKRRKIIANQKHQPAMEESSKDNMKDHSESAIQKHQAGKFRFSAISVPKSGLPGNIYLYKPISNIQNIFLKGGSATKDNPSQASIEEHSLSATRDYSSQARIEEHSLSPTKDNSIQDRIEEHSGPATKDYSSQDMNGKHSKEKMAEHPDNARTPTMEDASQDRIKGSKVQPDTEEYNSDSSSSFDFQHDAQLFY